MGEQQTAVDALIDAEITRRQEAARQRDEDRRQREQERREEQIEAARRVMERYFTPSELETLAPTYAVPPGRRAGIAALFTANASTYAFVLERKRDGAKLILRRADGGGGIPDTGGVVIPQGGTWDALLVALANDRERDAHKSLKAEVA